MDFALMTGELRRFIGAAIPKADLPRILGHASVSVTERHYAHLVNADIVALRHVLPGILRGGMAGVTQATKRR